MARSNQLKAPDLKELNQTYAADSDYSPADFFLKRAGFKLGALLKTNANVDRN
jgi:hypothetical protein